MSALTRIFLCLAVSLSLAGACAGQSRSKSRSRSRKAKPHAAQKRTEITVIAPDMGVTESREVGAATVNYLPSNITYVSVDLPEVYRGRGQTIGWSVSFNSHGREVVRPDYVNVSFDSEAGSFKANRLLLEADGRRFSFDIKSIPGAPEIEPNTFIDFTSFEQIANSKSVKGSMGRLTFELTESHLAALRDLLRTIEAPAKKP
jgi:hypothetical protein